MKSMNLQSVIRKKRKRYVKSTPQVTAENVLNRDFIAAMLNEKYLTDVTEFKLTNGTKTYLSAVIDLYDNNIVYYVLGHSNNNKLVFDTFDLAIERNISSSPLFHSYRGYQYTSKAFKLKLDKVSATQSMSHVGICIDNRPMEGFFRIIKSYMYYLRKFDNFDELKLVIDNYIELYNKILQKKLKGLSLIEHQVQTLID